MNPITPHQVAGCSLGHRTLKYRPYGKFAVSFLDLKTNTAVRISVVEKRRSDKPEKEAMKEAVTILRETPESDLFRIRAVSITIPEGDMPGLPKHKARYSRCTEMIVDWKEYIADGTVFCGNCAGVPYYIDIDLHEGT